MSGDDLSDFSMEELFRAEAESQCIALSEGLLSLEKTSECAPLLESLMRAAHSLKGAARIIGLDPAVHVAHAMEEIFVEAQRVNTPPAAAVVDVLLEGVDMLRQIAGLTEGTPSAAEIQEFVKNCQNPPEVKPAAEPPAPAARAEPAAAKEEVPSQRRDVRLDSERLDTLLGLAGQAMVTSRASQAKLSAARAMLRQIQTLLGEARHAGEERRQSIFTQALALAAQGQASLAGEHEQQEVHSRRLSHLCERIYNETLACRQRPFGDIAPGLRRLARDLGRRLEKDVDLEVSGEETEVDRDLLDRLDGPLSHLIRNALDHGLETPAERARQGKPSTGKLSISARHQAGWLVISVFDDGRGVNLETIKSAIVRRGLAASSHVADMPETEVLDFLLLPGFSLSSTVTEISGRGVGLDAVRAMAYGSGGSLRLSRHEGGGLLCELILPVSLSLVRALIVEIGGDFFALPLTRVDRVMQILPEDVHPAAGRQHIFLDDRRIEIFNAAQILETDAAQPAGGPASLVIIQGPQEPIGLVVDKLAGQKELSLQRLDPRLGRLQDVSATALLENGVPVVVLDVNDLAITAANFSAGARYQPVISGPESEAAAARRVLVADDSLTVRELERKLLASRGYQVETAVDGADAWNALRSGSYDLLVTDIDMPRLDGIELTKLIRADSRLRDLPIVVVSYKDREEDRQRGLEAGADFYLPKSSYQDESLVKAVLELIGDAVPT